MPSFANEAARTSLAEGHRLDLGRSEKETLSDQEAKIAPCLGTAPMTGFDDCRGRCGAHINRSLSVSGTCRNVFQRIFEKSSLKLRSQQSAHRLRIWQCTSDHLSDQNITQSECRQRLQVDSIIQTAMKNQIHIRPASCCWLGTAADRQRRCHRQCDLK